MKRIYFVVFAVFVFVNALSQNKYFEQYQKLVNKRDTTALKSFISEWEKAEGKTADVYAALFNYYLLCDMEDVLSLTSNKPRGEYIVAADSTGEEAFYIGGTTVYAPISVRKALELIDEGIGHYPDRLDLLFGKIHILKTCLDYNGVLKQIHTTLGRSLENNNQWSWTFDESVPSGDGKQFFLDTMQAYFNEIYETENDSIAMALADDLLEHYPDNIAFLNDKASLMAIRGDNNAALELFLKIHEMEPSDEIVILNIAYLYKSIDKEKARQYYRLLLKSKDDETRALSEEALENLEK